MASLRGAINDSQTEIQVDDTTSFPTNGGVVLIEAELVRYTYATDKAIFGCERGFNSTTPADHADKTALEIQDTTAPLYGLQEYNDHGTPMDHLTGVGFALKGSRYTDLDTATIYLNTSDETDPIWVAVGSGSGGSASGPAGAVQLSDGAGGFVNDPMFAWRDVDNTLRLGVDAEGVALSLTATSGAYIYFADEGVTASAQRIVGGTAPGSEFLIRQQLAGEKVHIQSDSGQVQLDAGDRVLVSNGSPNALIDINATTSGIIEFNDSTASTTYGSINSGTDEGTNALVVRANTGDLMLRSLSGNVLIDSSTLSFDNDNTFANVNTLQVKSTGGDAAFMLFRSDVESDIRFYDAAQSQLYGVLEADVTVPQIVLEARVGNLKLQSTAGDLELLTPTGQVLVNGNPIGGNAPAFFTTNSFTSTASTSYVDSPVTVNFAVSDPTHRVKITTSGGAFNDTAGNQSYFSIKVDGVDIAADSTGFTSLYTTTTDIVAPLSIVTVHTPGDTSSKAYTVVLKGSGIGNTRFPVSNGTIVVEEII